MWLGKEEIKISHFCLSFKTFLCLHIEEREIYQL